MKNSLAHRLDSLALNTALADCTPCRAIEADEVIRLADEADDTGRTDELAA